MVNFQWDADLDLEKAMDVLQIPIGERAKYAALVKG